MLKQRLEALPQDEKLWKKLMCTIIRLTCVKKRAFFMGYSETMTEALPCTH